ncbi:MAG: substrate-binding domain-containing protein [Anaerolineae bacterium]|nr:substrate-binding domain-containing protein [Anaerolineae bacterium]
MASSRKNRPGPTLGFFIDHTGGYYEAIWDGIVQVATEYNANALCFVGGELDSQIRFQRHWNVIYNLADSTNLDGLIISAALQNYVTIEDMTQFCARYAPLPIVVIASELPGFHSITVDNSIGLRELTRHLIDHHHYKRIAFIWGPENNQEAEIRYKAYVETLKDHNIPLDPNLVVPGNFNIGGGVEAIKMLLDQRRVRFDAVVASNDAMAVGAWQELSKRGFKVPEDVAITGFDDMPEARIFVTPLTTVRQPVNEQGQHATRMLLDYLQRGTPLKNLILETELIIRESCGCLSSAVSSSSLSIPTIVTDVPMDSLTQQQSIAVSKISKTICPYFPEVSLQSVDELVNVFFDTLQGDDSLPFLSLFRHLLGISAMNISHTELERGIMGKWQEAISIFREIALPYKRPEVLATIDGLLHQGRILIAEAAERAHSCMQSRAGVSLQVQSALIRDINAASDVQQIADILAEGLPRLGIHIGSLALYVGDIIPSPESRLIMAYVNEKRFELGPDGEIFPSVQLMPDDILPDDKPLFLIIHPLVAHDNHFGFIVMEMIVGHLTILYISDGFSEQIGSALYKALLMQQIEQSNQHLQQHASELADANAQLEHFAYIASHDLQEPLRMVSSYLQLIEKRYKDKLDDDAREFIEYAVDGASRMKRMIDALLAYSRLTTGRQPLDPTDCGQILAQAISNLKVAIQEANALITHDPLPTIMVDGTQLLMVFQNLISNAAKFHAERRPHIHISARQSGDEWIFSVCDNGIGIAPENIERLFVIFGRLHSQADYPGTGIGLAMCKKVVERHGGHIWVESQPGEGATFFFSIPAYPLSIC